MKAEIDVILRDPCEKVNITFIESSLENSNLYRVVHKVDNNYLLLLDNSNNYKIRVHEDGRVYIRKDYGSENESFDENVIEELMNGLKRFLYTTNFLNSFVLQNEINFSFSGKKAYGFFWKKYSKLNSIGEEYFNKYNIRTYTSNSESIYVRLEPVDSIREEHNCVGLFCN